MGNTRWGLLVLVLLALLLRLPGLTESLWYDEVYHTRVYFDEPEKRRLLLLWEDVHPPLYAGLMLGWTRLVGDSEVAIRLPSLLFALASLLVLWRIACSWLGSGQAWLVAALLALSPVHIWYSHESKANMLLMLLTTAAVWCYWSAAESGRARDWVAGSAILLAGLFNHAYAVPVALAIFIWLGWRTLSQPALLKPVLASGLVLGLTWLPLAAAKFLVRGEGMDRWYLREFTFGELYRLLLIWLPHGNTVRTLTNHDPWSQLLAQPWPYFLVDGLVALMLVRGLLRQSLVARQAWSARLLLLWFGMPLALTLAVSLIIPHSYIERNMLVVLPSFLILLVAGASEFRSRSLSRLAQGSLLALTLAGPVNLLILAPDANFVFHLKPDWQSAARYLASEPGNLEIFVTAPTSELAYYAPKSPMFVHQITSGKALLAAREWGWRPLAPLYLVLNSTWRGCWNEVWPVFARDPRFRLTQVREFRGLSIYRFEPRVGEEGPTELAVDLGGETQGLLTATGFYPGEGSSEGGSFVWSQGPLSRLWFWLGPAPADSRLFFHGRHVEGVPAVSMRVRLNDRELGEVNWTQGSFETLELPVPGSALQLGANLLQLEYVPVVRLGPTDSRQGSLCFDWIRLIPVGGPR